MDRLVLYQGVFGCWGWEVVNDAQQVIAESPGVFGNLEECVQDAEARGYARAARTGPLPAVQA